MSADYRAGDRIVTNGTVYVLSEADASSLRDGGLFIQLPTRVEVVAPDVVSLTRDAVTRAVHGFVELGSTPDEAITKFFHAFARRLSDDTIFAKVREANDADVDAARRAGKQVGRLVVDDKMRQGMIDSALVWAQSPVRKEDVVDTIVHEGWMVEKIASPLGVVAFVFEGRPNVCVDAAGVLRSGNSCVFRIGSDALRTASAILESCLYPALREHGLPEDAVVLVESAQRSAGLALFNDARVSLAVARGSGQAVRDLGSVARASGIAVSLHGTGGAWMLLGEHFDSRRLNATLLHSLDRKVCNTVNVVCVPDTAWVAAKQVIVDVFRSIAESRSTPCVVHLVAQDMSEFEGGTGMEIRLARHEDLSTEWEWEDAPELFLVRTRSFDEGITLCNTYSPHFIVSIVSSEPDDLARAWQLVDAPFVGDGFTRWVDGQFALDKPELGLSNWQNGRTLARSGILSGDDIRTFRFRMTQTDDDLRR